MVRPEAPPGMDLQGGPERTYLTQLAGTQGDLIRAIRDLTPLIERIHLTSQAVAKC